MSASNNSGSDVTAEILANTVSRNNYVRALCVSLVALFWLALLPTVSGPLFTFAAYSLLRGLWRDVASFWLYKRSPTAFELRDVSQRPGWAQKRPHLVVFPCSISDRDQSVVHDAPSIQADDPVSAALEIQAAFERKALTLLGDSVRCFQLRRHYDNYPSTLLCPLPGEPTGGATAFQSFCFCQRRKEASYPYLALGYIHIFISGQIVESRVYGHLFMYSTWFGKEDERLRSATFLFSLTQMWNEAIGNYLEKNQRRARPAGETHSGSQGRSNR